MWCFFVSAVGPGCPDISLQGNGTVVYHLEHGSLDADIACLPGHRLAGTDLTSKTLHCSGSTWNDTVTPCLSEYQTYTFNVI